MRTWLLLDCNYLCWRAFHSMGELSHGAIKTGVIFGFLRAIVDLQDQFGTQCVAFCFDVGAPKRRQLLECYKAKRHSRVDRTEEEERAREHMRIQVEKLRTEYLVRIGYRNVYFQNGYEADDMIACLTQQIRDGDEAIIVSADGDLRQLIRHNVLIYNPQKHKTEFSNNGIITLQAFMRVTGITPPSWAKVKALAGCKSDEVPGIPGIGEKTAIKYLRGELKPGAKLAAIEAQRSAIYRTNKPVVLLPFAGATCAPLREDKLSQEGWEDVCAQLGLKSLRGLGPLASRAQRNTNGFGLQRR